MGPARQRQRSAKADKKGFVAIPQRGEACGCPGHVFGQNSNDDLSVIRAAEQRFKMTNAGRLQPLPWRNVPRNSLAYRGGDHAHTLLVNRDQNVFLGGEVIVERAGQHAHRLCNVTHRGRVKAFFAKEPGGGIEDVPKAAVGSRCAEGSRKQDVFLNQTTVCFVACRPRVVNSCSIMSTIWAALR
jgi:hypothetical protein